MSTALVLENLYLFQTRTRNLVHDIDVDGWNGVVGLASELTKCSYFCLLAWDGWQTVRSSFYQLLFVNNQGLIISLLNNCPDIWLQGVAIILPQVQLELNPVRVEFATLSLYVGLILGASAYTVLTSLPSPPSDPIIFTHYIMVHRSTPTCPSLRSSLDSLCHTGFS